ncbi:MAG: M14 family metallopeptidase [Balneola sp.]
MNKFLFISLIFVSLLNCKSTEQFTGFSYDPPNVTDTQDKEVNPQYRRIIGTGEPTVWVSNKFEGARLNDFYALNDSTFEVYIEPENAPINNSPWYAFSIWSDTAQTVTLRLNYNNARHRYVPKISSGTGFTPIDMSAAVYDTASKTLEFEIELTKDPKTVSAQIITDTKYYEEWLSTMAKKSSISIEDIGLSKLGNPIKELTINEVDPNQEAGVLVIMGRQHPPEVTGFLASLYFIDELSSDTPLAKNFRNHFIVRAFPLINIDGVLNGHWRHNAGGIDLNRDWENFNQPETKLVRDALLPILDSPLQTVYYGIDFHSTNENLFYPIEQSVNTFPDDLTQRWIPFVEEANPNVKFVTEEFDTSSPISKNWIFKTFGADAVTFEMDDVLEENTIEEISRSAAQSLMQLLIDEKIRNR